MKHSGQLELTWTNKHLALLSAADGRYDYTWADPTDYRVSEVRLLREVDRFGGVDGRPEDSKAPTPTTDNLLITGDAMHALQSLAQLPEYAERYLGKVKLVYIDPPFNTGQTFEQYEDGIEHSIWLTMLRDRVRQMLPLLADDGSLWVHLDDSENHRCRMVLDEELGSHNFIAEVVWEKADSPNNSAQYLSKDTDSILVFAKNKAVWRPHRLTRSASSDAHYSNPDGDPRGAWYAGDPFANKPYSLGLYEVVGPTGRTFSPPPGRFWRISEAKFRELEVDGRIYWGPQGSARPSIKRYLSEMSGLTPRTLWRHVDVGSNRTSKNEMRALFPSTASFATPKPERLLQRIIEIGSRPGDVVLDCYAGSGTTAAVAHKLGRRWVTSELASTTVSSYTLPRLQRVVTGADPGGISASTQRVPVADLPDGVSPEAAREFVAVLGKLAETVNVDTATLRSLRSAARTRDERTQRWFGGGGFTHVEVGPSMFEEVDGVVVVADWAVDQELARAVCAQIGVRHTPEGIFAGRRGRTRVVVLDAMVGGSTIDGLIDQVPDGELVEVWSTQAAPEAAPLLAQARPGSTLHRIPESVLDTYRTQPPARRAVYKESATA